MTEVFPKRGLPPTPIFDLANHDSGFRTPQLANGLDQGRLRIYHVRVKTPLFPFSSSHSFSTPAPVNRVTYNFLE